MLNTDQIINARVCERCEVLYSTGCEHCDLCDCCDDHRECARVFDLDTAELPYSDDFGDYSEVTY